MSSFRRLLVISTTFFPDPTVSAIRMTQWCRHLPEHGWKPHVLCRYYGYEASPEELAAVVHPEVTVEYLDKPKCGQRANGSQQAQGWPRRLLEPLRSRPAIATVAV